jgi:hypothetical protein
MRTASIQLRILSRSGILNLQQRTVRFYTKYETSITFIRWLFHVVKFGSDALQVSSLKHIEYSQTTFNS